MRLEVAQYRELAAFAQFGSDLDEDTKRKLERGKRIVEILKQGQYVPMAVEDQVAIFFAVTQGLMDNVPVEKIVEFEPKMVEYVKAKAADALKAIKTSGELADDTSAKLKKTIEEFKETLEYISR